MAASTLSISLLVNALGLLMCLTKSLQAMRQPIIPLIITGKVSTPHGPISRPSLSASQHLKFPPGLTILVANNYGKKGAEFGLKCMPAGNTGVQMGGWFNKEINSADDLKDLKIRIPGLGGDVMSKLGASPISLPGGQIYENLVSGSIDATEWVGPWNDYAMKFYEAAKYYYYPGFHEPGSMASLGMNAEWC